MVWYQDAYCRTEKNHSTGSLGETSHPGCGHREGPSEQRMSNQRMEVHVSQRKGIPVGYKQSNNINLRTDGGGISTPTPSFLSLSHTSRETPGLGASLMEENYKRKQDGRVEVSRRMKLLIFHY